MSRLCSDENVPHDFYRAFAAGADLRLVELFSSPIPNFTATVLTGEKVSSAQLIGQPTILIVTPSTEAATDTRLWAEALRKNVNQREVRIIDVLAIDLPFFMSEEDAIGRAKEKIPARYQDQTWILSKSNLETALNIPSSSAKAFVFVLNAQGNTCPRRGQAGQCQAHGYKTGSSLDQVGRTLWDAASLI